MFSPQKTRLLTNLLSEISWFQSFRLLNAWKDPRQLENSKEEDSATARIDFFIIVDLRIYG
jgi:hypothetical protein